MPPLPISGSGFELHAEGGFCGAGAACDLDGEVVGEDVGDGEACFHKGCFDDLELRVGGGVGVDEFLPGEEAMVVAGADGLERPGFGLGAVGVREWQIDGEDDGSIADTYGGAGRGGSRSRGEDGESAGRSKDRCAKSEDACITSGDESGDVLDEPDTTGVGLTGTAFCCGGRVRDERLCAVGGRTDGGPLLSGAAIG